MAKQDSVDHSECNCEEFCSRWGENDDGTGGFYCPYNPFSETVCKQTLYKNMKPKVVKKTDA